jgi:hypothetical protein
LGKDEGAGRSSLQASRTVHGVVEPVFLQVRAFADPVDHGEKAGRRERRENAVPGAAVEVDPLPRRGAEGQRRAGGAALVGGDDHEERVQDMGRKACDPSGWRSTMSSAIGQAARLGFEQADPRAPLHEIQRGAVVEAPAEALVDDPVGIARGLQHLAERGEGRRPSGAR